MAKAYRPSTLMEMLAKPLSSCIAEILSYQAEKHNLLPKSNFGGHPGRNTTDALHLTVKFIFNQWRKGNVVSALFLDIKGAFPSVKVNQLIHNMRMKGIPLEYTNWVLNRLQGQQMRIHFNDFTSDLLNIDNSCDQGNPTSVILYHFYNAGLIDIVNESQAEKHNLLPKSNFGGHPGRNTTDALHLTVKFIFNQWRKGNVVSALCLNIKGAFPSVKVNQLIHNM